MKKILIILFVLLFLVGCGKTTKNNKQIVEKKQVSEIKQEKKILTTQDYLNNNVDELGEIPIMMYHGIENKNNSDTKYTGGNVDKDGYQRTAEAFRNDLEFYYQNGYRMIRLNDYVDGNIDVELGKSPIVLTFDDGLLNNIKINGIDENDNLIIDENCAIGILESFKSRYPDYHVTATFFVNAGLFQQPEYNEEILKWLVNSGYDIGNHTYSHVNFSKASVNTTQEEVGSIYEILDKVIPNKYINIVALPYGSPYNLEHENMNYIFNTTYNGKNYLTKSALRVGWKAESSPFSNEFNPKFLKRIRAYDNDGVEFDIKMNFDLLQNNRYISDGNKEKIVAPKLKQNILGNNYTKEILFY